MATALKKTETLKPTQEVAVADPIHLTQAPDAGDPSALSRRRVLGIVLRGGAALALGAVGLSAVSSGHGASTRWQIDPEKCNQCGRCATSCVLKPSAVKCFHGYGLCGYCDYCTGFFKNDPPAKDTGAENQLCPTSAIQRKYVEPDRFEFNIDKQLCIGCGRCVKGCGTYGNGSLYLQIDHDLCTNCNLCSIWRDCPSRAIVRVPIDEPYLLKTRTRTG
jgi:Na+-translocating ferredoxin:NAD+ oxidoreductase subunit B